VSLDRLIPSARVLVTGAGGPSAVAVMQSLNPTGITLYAADIDPYAAGLYLVDESRRAILPRAEDPGFVDAVLSYCIREQLDAVVPTVDAELIPLAAARDRFADSDIELVLASEQTLRVCLDKWALHQLCDSVVRCPATVVVDASFDAALIELPVIVKPRVGSGSRGIRQVESREELEQLERDGSLLVQELLPGAEYSLDVLADGDGQILAVVPRERLKVDSGIAVTGRTLHDEQLERFGREVALLIGLAGVANVQVKLDRDGAPALLEVNPRFPGTMPLTIASGIDMPRLFVAAALGGAWPSGPLEFTDIAMVRFFQERFLDPDEITRLEDHRPLVTPA
jgi:carbamoyl-phosphate synthase large subunit